MFDSSIARPGLAARPQRAAPDSPASRSRNRAVRKWHHLENAVSRADDTLASDDGSRGSWIGQADPGIDHRVGARAYRQSIHPSPGSNFVVSMPGGRGEHE